MIGRLARVALCAVLVMDTQPEEAKRALANFETTSRDSLAEMWCLLGVLRGDDGDVATLIPAPGIAALPALVAQTSEAGLGTTLLVTGPLRALPPSVELSTHAHPELVAAALRAGA